MSTEDSKLEVSLGAGGIIDIEIGGNLTSENIPKFVEWVEEVKRVIAEVYKKNGMKVLALVDISGLTKYEPEVLTRLATLMKENEPYVLKTATFGGSDYMVMAQDIVVALSGRNNLKAFSTRVEAIDWLQEEEKINN